MKFDCANIPIRNHDYVVLLDEEFAKYGPNGKNLEYGIVYGTKWILPLGGKRKKQLETGDYVKLLNKELLPEVKSLLDRLYLYYKKNQVLPENPADLLSITQDEVDEFEQLRAQWKKISSPFDEDESEGEVAWVAEEYDEDDLSTDIYETDDLI